MKMLIGGRLEDKEDKLNVTIPMITPLSTPYHWEA